MQRPKLLTPGEVAEQLNVTHQTLWRWRQAGEGPTFVRLGKSKHSPVRYLPLTVTDMTKDEDK